MNFEAVIKATFNPGNVEAELNKLTSNRKIKLIPEITSNTASIDRTFKKSVDKTVTDVEKYVNNAFKNASTYQSGDLILSEKNINKSEKALRQEQANIQKLMKERNLSYQDAKKIYNNTVKEEQQIQQHRIKNSNAVQAQAKKEADAERKAIEKQQKAREQYASWWEQSLREQEIAQTKSQKRISDQQKKQEKSNQQQWEKNLHTRNTLAKDISKNVDNSLYTAKTEKYKSKIGSYEDLEGGNYKKTVQALRDVESAQQSLYKTTSSFNYNPSVENTNAIIKANQKLQDSYKSLDNELSILSTQQSATKLGKQKKQAEKILDNFDNQTYLNQYNKKKSQYDTFAIKDTDDFKTATSSIENLTNKYNELTAAKQKYVSVKSNETETNLVKAQTDYNKALKDTTNSFQILSTNGGVATAQKKLSLFQRQLNSYATTNPRVYKNMKDSFDNMNQLLSSGNVTTKEFDSVQTEFAKIKNIASSKGLEGNSFFGELKRGAKQIGQFVATYGLLQAGVNKFSQSIIEIKDIDTILTEISKTSNRSRAQLQELGKSSYSTASKYGRKASDYLLGVQEMNRSGYYGQKGNQMAELSVLAQSAGDLDADMANSYLLATDAAFKYQGSVEKLNAVLDGQNAINVGRAA